MQYFRVLAFCLPFILILDHLQPDTILIDDPQPDTIPMDDPQPEAQPEPQPIDQAASGSEEKQDQQFDQDLVDVLEEAEPDTEEFGEDLQDKVAQRFQQILLNGLKKEARETLLKKYLFPKNVPLSKAPALNAEISAMLVDPCKLRDKRLLTKQNQLGKGLSALGKAITMLLQKNVNLPDVIRTLNDAGTILADSHYAETDSRRTVILPLIDKTLSEPFKDRKRDSFLFGDKLGEVVKSSRGIKKTGQLIQANTHSLNSKGPSSRTRQFPNVQTYRSGGPKPFYPQNRRRFPFPQAAAAPLQPPPAPATTRRYQAPPTQTPRRQTPQQVQRRFNDRDRPRHQ